jgi:hypothetical protein
VRAVGRDTGRALPSEPARTGIDRLPNRLLSALAEFAPTRSVSRPLVSVIVDPAFLQTSRNIQALVIGDGRTDDTEQVVRSVTDEPVGWFSLETNPGSQSLPDNLGPAQAGGGGPPSPPWAR